MAAGTRRLGSLDIQGVADFIASGACRSIVALTGAGVSTGAGIPDFRSSGGMYDSLRPELLTATDRQREAMRREPTMVVTKDMFFQNQFPYLEVRRPFILGTQEQRWKATLSHWFFKFLEEDGLLTRLFTQNIDGLDYQTGISRDRVCNVHGSIAEVQCEGCGETMELDEFCGLVRSKIKDIYGIDGTAPKESTNIPCKRCARPTLKPRTVLFGGSMPRDFFALSSADCPAADLLIVAGTSLVVSPANGLVQMVGAACPRLIVNKERVGEELGICYGDRAVRDVFAGERGCDDVFAELMLLLGWKDRLVAIQDRLPEGSRELLSAL